MIKMSKPSIIIEGKNLEINKLIKNLQIIKNKYNFTHIIMGPQKIENNNGSVNFYYALEATIIKPNKKTISKKKK